MEISTKVVEIHRIVPVDTHGAFCLPHANGLKRVEAKHIARCEPLSTRVCKQQRVRHTCMYVGRVITKMDECEPHQQSRNETGRLRCHAADDHCYCRVVGAAAVQFAPAFVSRAAAGQVVYMGCCYCRVVLLHVYIYAVAVTTQLERAARPRSARANGRGAARGTADCGTAPRRAAAHTRIRTTRR
eukprot:COSAG05_NODE_1365_length_5065_cov_3.435360_2_plen_186_part_00